MNSQVKQNQLGFQNADDTFNSIYKQLEQLSKRDTAKNNPEYWLELRSKIYIDDNGVCWICGRFVELRDYDLGHIVDKCMGGWDDYDNLAVMHTKCNLSKPRHTTREEAERWRFNNRNKNTVYIPTPNTIPKIEQPILPINNQPEIKPRIYTNLSIYCDKCNSANVKTDGKQTETRDDGNTYIIQYYHCSDCNNSFKKERINNDVEEKHPKRIKRQHHNTPKLSYEEQCARIKPCTVCWIQGYPNGGAMWRLMPPNENGEYLKENAFCMRQTPQGAIEPTGENGIIKTLQVIGGILTSDIEVDLGINKLLISPNNDSISAKFITTNKSNSGIKNDTIGFGDGQIPMALWRIAKRQGLSLEEFKIQYHNKA